MKWYKNLYVGESIKGKEEKIKKKLNRNAGQIRVHVISLASNGVDLFDIIPAWEITLLRKYYNDIYVVGLAGDYDEAINMAASIANKMYLETGSLELRKYFIENWE